MTIERRGREVRFERSVQGAVTSVLRLGIGGGGTLSMIEGSDTVMVFKWDIFGGNGGARNVTSEFLRFISAAPRSSGTAGTLPQGYGVRREKINSDPVCQKRGIVWKDPNLRE